MEIWICGQMVSRDPDHKVWEFQGAFSTEQLAIDECKTDLYFIAPCTLDESLPDETFEWPGAYYPKAEP